MSMYDAVKDAVNIARQADNVELYRLLLDVQKESLDLLDENRELKERVRVLNDNSQVANSLVFNKNCYFMKEDTDFKEPYCSNCWDGNRKLIRMHVSMYYPDNLGAKCRTCNTTVRNLNR